MRQIVKVVNVAFIIGVIILNAERITAWCDRQLGEKDEDGNDI